ncbi:hypothetical protein WICMUC_003347 [Wickerhamomyces mucosus]|uniref:DUF676 domain-containing protein n=1 Tax=Wickerhamomyces mucosus TaxID=1378264 RepID=A0A9P8PMW1_9ASCO|nr:hypothetical protein WICMUC_003347 [Wickerhamomyces mucosus]
MVETAHLFVLVHGLWGGAGHLKAVEDIITKSIVDSDEKILIIRPKTSGLVKTYDGVEIIGQRMLIEILNEINRLYESPSENNEELQQEPIMVKKISFLGYSLGGIVSRYIIGEFERLGLFKTIKPMYFTSIASPHVGVWFYKQKVMNILGSNVLGLIGKELLITDKRQFLVKLSEGDYLKGLKKFEKRFLFANVRHDRSVSYYTAYITDSNPFDEHWDKLKISYEHKDLNDNEDLLSTYEIKNIKHIKPSIINIAKTDFKSLDELKKDSKISIVKTLKFTGIILAFSMILPMWIPVVLTATAIGTGISYVIVKTFKRPDESELKKLVSHLTQEVIEENISHNAAPHGDDEDDEHRDEVEIIEEEFEDELKESNGNLGLRERVEEATETFLETAINISQYETKQDNKLDISDEDDDDESLSVKKNSSNPPSPQIFSEKPNIKIIKDKTKKLFENLSNFKNPSVNQFKIFNQTSKLPLDHNRKTILQNLNSLDWYKFAVCIDVINAHDNIICRKGLQRSNPKGISNILMWAQLINEDIKENKKRR